MQRQPPLGVSLGWEATKPAPAGRRGEELGAMWKIGRGSHEHADADRDATDHLERTALGAYGGMKFGAAFFGWLVTVGITALLIGVIGAIAAAAGASTDVTQSDVQREAGTIGVWAAIVLVVVLLVGYYAGGYVAGRLSRFERGRQGLLVWLLGLVLTVLAVLVGLVAGSEYNFLDRIALPRMPIPTEQFTRVGTITAVVIVVGTLLAAMLGGSFGHRYHDKVDRAVSHG
jgi:hypothetical protein